jgi:hypothetical protein
VTWLADKSIAWTVPICDHPSMADADQRPPYDVVETPAGRMVVMSALGDPVVTSSDAIDLISVAGSEEADWVVLPETRLTPEFFRLRTGVAGEIAQRFVNYRVGLVVLGDISRYTEDSPTLRDLIRESNHGPQMWFLRDQAELDERLNRHAGRTSPTGP